MSAIAESIAQRWETSNPQEASRMGPEERWFSMASGACLIGLGLSRLRLGPLLAVGVGAYVLYRGASGHCLLREKLAEARQHNGLGHELMERAQRHLDSSPETCATGDLDCVDEAVMESFPASDAPSYTGAKTAPAAPIE